MIYSGEFLLARIFKRFMVKLTFIYDSQMDELNLLSDYFGFSFGYVIFDPDLFHLTNKK